MDDDDDVVVVDDDDGEVIIVMHFYFHETFVFDVHTTTTMHDELWPWTCNEEDDRDDNCHYSNEVSNDGIDRCNRHPMDLLHHSQYILYDVTRWETESVSWLPDYCVDEY